MRNSIEVTKMDRLRHEKVRELVKEEALQDKIEKARLKWYGHVKRMEGKRTPRRIHETEMKGKRPRGRPRDRWLKGVEECIQKKEEDWIKVKTER